MLAAVAVDEWLWSLPKLAAVYNIVRQAGASLIAASTIRSFLGDAVACDALLRCPGLLVCDNTLPTVEVPTAAPALPAPPATAATAVPPQKQQKGKRKRGGRASGGGVTHGDVSAPAAPAAGAPAADPTAPSLPVPSEVISIYAVWTPRPGLPSIAACAPVLLSPHAQPAPSMGGSGSGGARRRALAASTPNATKSNGKSPRKQVLQLLTHEDDSEEGSPSSIGAIAAPVGPALETTTTTTITTVTTTAFVAPAVPVPEALVLPSQELEGGLEPAGNAAVTPAAVLHRSAAVGAESSQPVDYEEDNSCHQFLEGDVGLPARDDDTATVHHSEVMRTVTHLASDSVPSGTAPTPAGCLSRPGSQMLAFVSADTSSPLTPGVPIPLVHSQPSSKPPAAATSIPAPAVAAFTRLKCSSSEYSANTPCEDKHCCVQDPELGVSIFCVFDGHGGDAASKFAKAHMSDIIRARLTPQASPEEVPSLSRSRLRGVAVRFINAPPPCVPAGCPCVAALVCGVRRAVHRHAEASDANHQHARNVCEGTNQRRLLRHRGCCERPSAVHCERWRLPCCAGVPRLRAWR